MQHRPGSLQCLTCNLVKYFLREVDFKPYTDLFSRTFILSSLGDMQKRSFKSLHHFLLVVRKCKQNYLSIFSFYFFHSIVASFWVLLSGLFGCQSEQRTKNIVISIRSGVFVKSTPPTTQIADVARYFKKRQTFYTFVFLISRKGSPVDKVGRFRMILQRQSCFTRTVSVLPVLVLESAKDHGIICESGSRWDLHTFG